MRHLLALVAPVLLAGCMSVPPPCTRYEKRSVDTQVSMRNGELITITEPKLVCVEREQR